MSNTSPIVDVDTASFEREVLQRSLEVPVLIDFWAEWCGPCKTLGPILEKLAVDMNGAFVLAKVDIDREPRLAEAFRIQSIPTVMLLVEGRPVDAFMGAQSEAEIRRFLEPHLTGAASTDAVGQAAEYAERGDLDGAIAVLRERLREAPDDGAASVALAGHLLAADRAEDARQIVDGLTEEQRATPEAKGVIAQLELLAGAGDVEELRAKVEADPKDLAARIELGKALVAAQRYDEGLEAIWEAALRDLSFDDAAPRKALIEVFQVLGPDDPRTLEYQQRLSVLLCS